MSSHELLMDNNPTACKRPPPYSIYFDVFVDQNFKNLREGLQKGVSQPIIIFDGYESTYNDHITSNYLDNYFYSPFKNLPSNINSVQADSLLNQAKYSIENIVVPQFKRIKKYNKK